MDHHRDLGLRRTNLAHRQGRRTFLCVFEPLVTRSSPLADLAITTDGPSGSWCWVNSAYQLERLLVHYLWVFIVAFFNLLFYSIIAIYLRYHDGGRLASGPLAQTANISRVMLIYPVVYVATM